jgi:hypothetical protein
MTVAQYGAADGSLCRVVSERPGGDGVAEVTLSCGRGRINPDLRIGAPVAATKPLEANGNLCWVGVKLFGQGFVLSPENAVRLQHKSGRHKEIIRRYLSGRDLAQKSREQYVIDLLGWDESKVRKEMPEIYQYLLEAVKPERDQNNRAAYRKQWWIFGEPRKTMRPALAASTRYVGTPEVAKHRVFQFIASDVVPEGKICVIALEDAFFLGIVSSHPHVTWSLSAGGRLGVGDDPVYVKTNCFDPFPFPACTEEQKQRIRDLGEQLDAHRKRQQEMHPDLTITGMYNVLEKLRANEPLTEKEKVIHEKGLVSILKQIHDDLDAAVFDAYGWPRDLSDEEILGRLVALNHERAEEEKRGLIRWLRPEFQNPSGVQAATQQEITLVAEPGKLKEPAAKPEWPATFPDQLLALRSVMYSSVAPWTLKTLAREFRGAKRKQIETALESLEALGIVVSHGEGDGKMWTALRPAAHQRRFTPISV